MVVVTWRGVGQVAACLDGLAGQTAPHRTLVVDNGSDDGTAAVLAAHPSRPEVLRLPRNTGYAGALAAALPRVGTPFLAWLNDDAVPEPGWLAELESALDAAPDAAAASAALVLPDGTTQSVGVRLTRDGHGADLTEPEAASRQPTGDTANLTEPEAAAGQPTGEHAAPGSASRQPAGGGSEVFGFCGGAALVRTDALRRVGGVPARFFCYYEDTDTSWRLRLAGWRVVPVLSARVRHRHGASSRLGSARFHRWNERNRLLMLLRCAPAGVAAREVARFAVITALLPVRAVLRAAVPAGANFRVGLRVRVLGEVLVALPATLAARARIGRTAAVPRRTVWSAWAGR